MCHQHFCELGSGHYYECCGTAIQLFELEATACTCSDHGTPVAEGDHSKCSVERLPCPEHRREFLTARGFDPDDLPDASSLLTVLSLFTDRDGFPIAGWCPWCLSEFRSIDRLEEHKGNLWDLCQSFESLRNDKRIVELLESLDEFDFPDEEADD